MIEYPGGLSIPANPNESLKSDGPVCFGDARWVKVIADYYKAGGFQGKDIPPRVMNALDSISWFF